MYAILINYIGRYSKILMLFLAAGAVFYSAQFIRGESLPSFSFDLSKALSTQSKDISSSDVSVSAATDSKVIAEATVKPESSELEKLLKTIDLAKNQKVDIIFDGRNYTPFQMKVWARQYLKRNFNEGESAEEWVEKNTYRTEEGNIIYFRYKDGSQRPMRDVFLELLKTGQVSAA